MDDWRLHRQEFFRHGQRTSGVGRFPTVHMFGDSGHEIVGDERRIADDVRGGRVIAPHERHN